MSENQNMDIDPNQAVADQSADQQQQPPVPIEPVVQILPVTQETEPREIVPLAAVLNPTPADDRQGELWSSQQSRRPSPSSSSGESYTGDTDDNISVHSKNSTTFIDFYQASIWEANDYIEELEKLLRSTKLRADRALSKLTAIVKMIKELQKPPTGVSMENLMLAKKKIRQLYEIEGEIKQRFKTPKPMQVDLEQQQQSTSDPATARQRNAEVLQQDLDRRAEEERRAAEKARAEEARLEEIAIQKAITENLQVIEKIANKESELELAKRDLQNLKIRIENRFGIPYSEFQRRHLVIANLPPVGQGSSKPGPEIPDQSQIRQQDAPAPGTPRQRRALPKTIMKMDPYPNADCIFCLNGRHWSHLCCHPRYNTLQARVKAYQVRNLCFKCGTPHGYGTCPMPPPKCCRWFNCLSTEHHTNLCPNAPYPLNIAKAQGWVEALRDRKAASSPYERDDE